MKVFLYYIRTFPRMEDYTDRKLICSTETILEKKGSIELLVDPEKLEAISKIIPGKNYGLLFDKGGETEMKYLYLNGFEIDTKGKEVKLVLYATSI